MVCLIEVRPFVRVACAVTGKVDAAYSARMITVDLREEGAVYASIHERAADPHLIPLAFPVPQDIEGRARQRNGLVAPLAVKGLK
ncbi:hypothetical protein FKM82_005666 [Ascaphus truei]